MVNFNITFLNAPSILIGWYASTEMFPGIFEKYVSISLYLGFFYISITYSKDLPPEERKYDF